MRFYDRQNVPANLALWKECITSMDAHNRYAKAKQAAADPRVAANPAVNAPAAVNPPAVANPPASAL